MEDDKEKSAYSSDRAFQASADGSDADEQPFARPRWMPILRQLWDGRGLLARTAVVGFMLSAVIAFAIPKRYATSTRLMPPDPQSTSGMMMLAGLAEKSGSGLGAMAGDLLGLKSSGALFVGMLQSETIEDRLVQRFELTKIYKVRLPEDARNELSRNTDVQEDRKSGIIAITVTDRSAERAAAIANSYVSELNTMVAQLSTSSAHRERVFLEERLQAVKQELDEAEMQLAQFSSRNSTLDIQQQGKAMLDAASNLAGQTIAVESELQGLRQIYTENNARVREMTARVTELRKELDKLGGMDGNLSRGTHANAGPSEEQITDSSADLPYPSIRKLPLLGAKYADYYRAAKIQETVYELLTEQNELAKVEEAKETPSVKVLDAAEVPERKSYPPRLIVIGLGTLLMLGLGSLRAVAKARWDQMGPQDDRKMLAREVFAAVRVRKTQILQLGTSARAKLFGVRDSVDAGTSGVSE